MSLKKAKVDQVAEVNKPNGDQQAVLQVLTDWSEDAFSAFYLPADTEDPPRDGDMIQWGHSWVWWRDRVAKKVGLDFDPNRGLH